VQVNNAAEVAHNHANEAAQSSESAKHISSTVSNSPEEGLARSDELSRANSGPDASASSLYSSEAANESYSNQTYSGESLPTGDTGLADTRGDALTYELAREVFDDAVLSQDTYSDTIGEKAMDLGYTRLSEEQLSGILGEDVVLNDEDSGFAAAVYQGEDGKITVAYRGSEADTWDNFKEDWVVTNAGQAFVGVPEAYKQASELASQMKEAFGDDVMLTGHSLGGGMANYAAVDNNLDYNVFNAAGLAKHTIESLGSDVDNYSRTGNVINDEYDPLTNYGGRYNDETWGNRAEHVGEDNLVFLNNDSFKWFDTLFNLGKRQEAHSIAQMISNLAGPAGYGNVYA